MQPINKQGLKHIVIVYFDAASGHRSAALALKKVLSGKQPQSRITMVNITEIFGHHKIFGKIVRSGIDYFNWQIKKDKVFDLRGLINLSLLCHDLVGKKGLESISRYWETNSPDAIISVTPMYNPALYQSAALVNPAVKCITIPVDFEEVRGRYWFTPKVEQFYINATDRLEDQAVKAGIPTKFLYRTKGMLADGDAYDILHPDKTETLQKLGLNPALPTGFLSFGGQGTSNVLDIAKALTKLDAQFNMIIMCGKNKNLYQQVSALSTPFQKAVFSYLPETPINYLHLADFAIGKPGAMTITEALITRTPLIALKSKGMSPVQKGNEDWIMQSKTGIVAKTPEAVANAVKDILSNPELKKHISKHYHRSIFECADIIDQIINLN